MRPIQTAGKFCLLTLALAASAALAQGLPNGGVVTARAGDSLSRLAATHLGATRDWPAIMLATNGRLADKTLELRFIGDPNDLAIGQKVWVPDRREGAALLEQWRTYERAILDMSLPEPWEIERDLVVPNGDKVIVVTWARAGQYREPYPTAAEGDVWVTVEPYLQEFCHTAGRGEALIERLEQRLGLPPKSNKAEFVRIEIDPGAGGLFRPCADPRIDRSDCRLPAAGLESGGGLGWYPLWFYRQYHQAYGTARPTRYPWTSLGYTYDWGQPSEVGESEFVIRGPHKGAGDRVEKTPIRVLETVSTERYCATHD